MSDNDELVSQFLAFTGSLDTSKAASYLEMSGGNIETAVGLYMEHQAGGEAASGGGIGGSNVGGAMGGGGMDDIRAPDATQTMRLMDDSAMGRMGGMIHPYMQMDPMLEEQLRTSAFASPPVFDAREAVNAAAAADSENESKENMEDESDGDADEKPKSNIARLSDMFSPPDHIIFKEGGFDGARNMAKDNKRWLLVNLQRDSEFSCHALNRDVWRDELVENLIREGFIFWQAMDISPEGQVYAQRYHVLDYPHVAIIDPRTRRLMWKKEGWTMQNPLTSELFAETAMDFCSRHSFAKPPQAPRPSSGPTRPSKRPMHEMSEDEQLQAAMRASLQEASGDQDNDDDSEVKMEEDEDDDVEYLGTNEGDFKPQAEEKPEEPEEKEPSFLETLIAVPLGDEPSKGARIQFRMPDGKRTIRKFDASLAVKTIYAFVAQTVEEAKGGKEFFLMAGYPPKDLIDDIDNTIESSKLSGQAITVRWK